MVLIKQFYEGIFWFDTILGTKRQGRFFPLASFRTNGYWSRKWNITIINLTLPKSRISRVVKCPMFCKSSFCYSGMKASKTTPTGSTVLEALFIVEPPFYSGSRAPPVQRSNLQLISFLCPRLKVDFVEGKFMALDATCNWCHWMQSPDVSWIFWKKKDFLTRRWLFGLELSWSLNDILDSTTGSMFHLQVG